MSKARYLAAVTAIVFTTVVFLSAQTGSQGTVTVSVSDQSGGVVPGADLTLQDLATNDIRKGTTQSSGAYSFVGLNISTYKLTASKSGYASVVYDSVTVHAARVTDVNVTLKVAAIHETIEVKADEAPLVESTSSAIGTTIDLKEIENLPFGVDRDLTQLTTLISGYTPGTNGVSTWNGLPPAAQVNSIDGMIGNSSRFKDGGNTYAAASPRIQNIEEMAVQTDQLDVNQGYGQANMQVAFITRRGTNRFHGRLFGDLQNSSFNANSWMNDFYQVPISKFHKTDLGGSVGGPILKDKLFFFFGFERDGIPGSQQLAPNFMTPDMQSGIYTYKSTVDGSIQTVNLFTLAAAQSGLATTVDSGVAAELSAINSSLSGGTVESLQGFGLYNVDTLAFHEPNNQYFYYPTFRVDYNATQKLRVNFALNETKIRWPTTYAPLFPGQAFAFQTAGYKSNAYTASLGFDYTIKPTLINQFRGGYLYNYASNSENQSQDPEKYKFINWWAGPDGLNNVNQYFWYSAISNFYPLISFSDNVVWQHKSHNLTFGGSFYREQDHYWNAPLGYDNVVFGDWPGDPMNNVFNSSNPALSAVPSNLIGAIQGYYAILTGDIGIIAGSHPVNPQTHTYSQYGGVNLDELQKAWGLYVQDSWRVRPNLTVNYGLRWDFTGDDHDLNGIYFSPNQAGIFGPSGLNNLFNPGSLLGDPDPSYIARDHAYSPWNVSPQPTVGIAWSPQSTEGWLGKLTGGGKTVLRTGYSLRRYTEQYQSFWIYASNYGSFFYQNYQTQGAAPGTTGAGYYPAGSVSFSNYLSGNGPPQSQYFISPTSYSAQLSESSEAWQASLGGMNPHIAQPYIQSWNVGLQRELGKNQAIEIRYVGNRGVHEWVGENINEVNIFGQGHGDPNSFLAQFKAAQNNLKINQANGINSFANNGYPGQTATPIFDAAFAGEPSGGPGVPLLDYGPYNPFIQELTLGQVGSMANQIASPYGYNANYFCNLVPTSGPVGAACVANTGYSGAGGSYPENLLQANPYAAGSGVGYLNSVGYSTYNGLQLEFRQKSFHGMQFNANYTWSKNLAMTLQDTLRNMHLAYGPSVNDFRHLLNAYGTYDLPFGKGKSFLNGNGLLDRAVGGWTLGTVINYTSGAPFQLFGGNDTYNNLFDGGINLNGVTASQIQHAIGVYPLPCPPGTCTGNVPNARTWISPKFIAANGQASSLITPNETPGTVGALPWFHGLGHFNTNMSVSKAVAIAEGMRLNVQGEFFNLFNHPGWNVGDAGLQDNTFGQTENVTANPRVIEVRVNFEF